MEEKKYLKENDINIANNNKEKDEKNDNNNVLLEEINNLNLNDNLIENQYKYFELLSINELYNQFNLNINNNSIKELNFNGKDLGNDILLLFKSNISNVV